MAICELAGKALLARISGRIQSGDAEVPGIKPWITRCLSGLFATAGLCACVSMPQPTEQWITGRHAGTVVDAPSGRPLQGAQVHMVDFPEHSATTDVAGKFVLGPVIDSRGRTRNFFSSVDAAACVDRIGVQRTGYVPVTLDKGDDRTFRAACQNALFEYRIHLNPVQ